MSIFKRGFTKSQTQESQDLETLEYRSSIGPRTATTARSTLHKRSGSFGDLTGGSTLKIYSEMGSAPVPIGMSSAQVQTAAKSFVQSTAREKRDMQDLNDRLGNYLNRVKGLEEQNRRLVTDLEEMRNRWGKDTEDIKYKFASQLKDARKRMDDGARQRAEIDVRVARLQDELNNDIRISWNSWDEGESFRYDEIVTVRRLDKERIGAFNSQLSENNAEMDLLRQRLKSLEEEMKRYGKDNIRLRDEIHQANNALDDETISRVDYENQTQTLMEELEFLKRLHETELKELQHLLTKEPLDTREYFKNELALAIRDIRGEYDNIAKTNKTDMESWYKLKVTEAHNASKGQGVQTSFQREEIKRMRDAIADLRNKLTQMDSRNSILEKQVQELKYQLADDQRHYEMALNDREGALRKVREECQSLVAEMQALLDTKMILDAEIAIYRKMLEGEETRASGKEAVSTTRHSGHSWERAEPRRPPPPQERTDYRQTASWERKETRELSPRSSQRPEPPRAQPRQEVKVTPPTPPAEPQPPPRTLVSPPQKVREPSPPKHRDPSPSPSPPRTSSQMRDESFRTSEEVTLTRTVQEVHVDNRATFQPTSPQPRDMAPKPAIHGPAELPRSPKSAFRKLAGKSTAITEYYGTVFAANNFDPGKDADAIKKALGKTLGVDDKGIVNILCNRSNMQRQQIRAAYAKMYNKDLAKDLSDKMRGDVKTLVNAIMIPPAEFDANELRKAMKGSSTDESIIVEVLTPRSSAEIYAIRDAYRRMFNRELEKDIQSETTGKLRKLLVSIAAGYRDENNSVTDLFKARQDAGLLFQSGAKEFTTYDSAFTNIFTKESFTQLQLVCQEYRKISGIELEEAIEKELNTDTGRTLSALVKCVKNTPLFFAERVHKSMKGFGTDDGMLVRIIVSRCEVDTVLIKREFELAFKDTVENWIADDTSGSYKQGLLILIRKPQ